VVAFAVLPMLAASSGAVQAAEDDEASPPEAAVPQPPPKAELQPGPAVASDRVAAPAEPYIEHLGPETFPGRLRGLYGGSLWLEPTFHGLQWPRNTRTGLGVSGQVWVDSGYEMIKRDLPTAPDSAMYLQQGRAVLRFTPAYVNGNFFIQGQAEIVGNLCQTASVTNQACNAGTFSTDDLWLRVGQRDLWDIQVGRFLGWEIYHLGMGLDPYTLERMGAHMVGVDWPATSNPRFDVPAIYGVNTLQERATDGLAVGNAALHAYLADGLRVEVLGRIGTDKLIKVDANEDVPSTYRGGRATAIYDIGWFKLKAGAEYQKRTPTTQVVDVQAAQKKDSVEELVQWGAGGSAQFVIDPIVEFGLSAAYGDQSYTDSTGNGLGNSGSLARSHKTTSVGGFANLRPADGWLVGTGAHWTTDEDGYRATDSKANDYSNHLQGFLALQYLLAKQLYIKAVVAYAKAKLQPSDLNAPVWNNTMYSGRIRLMYLY
jgi:hypothetical protein